MAVNEDVRKLPRCVVVALDQLQIVLACPGALESESYNSAGPTCNVMFPRLTQSKTIQDNTRQYKTTQDIMRTLGTKWTLEPTPARSQKVLHGILHLSYDCWHYETRRCNFTRQRDTGICGSAEVQQCHEMLHDAPKDALESLSALDVGPHIFRRRKVQVVIKQNFQAQAFVF